MMDIVERTSIKKNMKFLNESQWWSEGEIENYQNEKLKAIVKHAYENVPFYNVIFKKLKLKPKDFKTKEDLKKLPIIRREDIKKNLKDFMALNANMFKPQIRSTGGTTGVPLVYYSDLSSWSLAWGLKFRAWAWSGYSLGDKIGILAGASLIPDQKKNFKKIIWSKFNRMYPMSMTHADDAMLGKYAKIVERENIHYLRGYPSSVAVFADYVVENNLKLDIKSVITTAEVLQPSFRESINAAFNCKVFDTYGCADAGANANECEMHNGLHVSPEPSIMELLDVENNKEVESGKTGEIVLTSLTNYAMPTLRYAPGDLGIKSDIVCSCGRKLPLLDKIDGRTTDIIKFSNGIRLGGPAFTLIFRNFKINNYQIIQHTIDSIDVNIVKANKFFSEDHKKLLKILRYHTGEGVTINTNYIKKIPVSKSGKFRFIISKV